jgi:5-formaminoimidazole-4-carboxamide-1-beta-D-ribofuranosyl 5'-monophosphate synthetase
MKSNSMGAGLYIINKIYKCNYMLKIEKKKKMGGVKLKKKMVIPPSKKLSADDIKDLIVIKQKRQKYEQELL